MKQVKRPCNHQRSDSDDNIPFNYCPWCGKFLATVVDSPKETIYITKTCTCHPHDLVYYGCRCQK